jgi:hypothetical protein
MSAVITTQTTWLNADFWELLDRIEGRHSRAQSDHESARRRLERVDPKLSSEIQEAWARYCEVIAELDRAAGELEQLRLSRI